MSENPQNIIAPVAPQSVGNRSIGELIREAKNLTPEQMDSVLKYQAEHGIRFGDAAVALGFVKRDDVLWALSRQFHYPYSAGGDSASTANPELVVANSPFSDEAEAFRNFRSQLISSVFNPGAPKKALAVVSPSSGEGKSFFCANLAVVFSQLGGRTLLVDADMRTPRQHEIFGVEGNNVGLSSVLAGRCETNVIRPIEELPSLYVLPVGATPPNPLELAQRPAFALLVMELLQKFDYVIVDTPAAAHGADARVISAVCGAAMVVGRRHHTSVSALKALADNLKKANITNAGIVLNDH
ncbi:polysaccharide biosynthesis tyrosine autokinase [Aquabacterium sp. A3]|uniref:polysaccharide biosynthesis tyrosine autokinase n=1 Tax=Aquabacterium sp. A3 TaxID=3132829 RepID=UPI00311A20BD